MTERLREILKQYQIKTGPTAKAELSLASGKCPRMIERYMSGTSVPSQHTAYRLALKCGCTDEEALELAEGCSSLARTA